jgi:intergrase/recombinase
MFKPVLPIPLIANSLGNLQNEQEYKKIFEELTALQDEAFNKISNKLSAALDQISEDDYDNALRLFALQLTSEANAHRIAAEKILHTLNKKDSSKPAAKDKSK